LFKELRSLAFLWEIIHHENLERERYRDIHVHAIYDPDTMLRLGVSSKLNAEWAFLSHLREQGKKAAQNWLARHYDDLNVRSTLDISWVFAESLRPGHLEEGAERNYSTAEPAR
jgi:NTE family protein